jgi:protoporphyrinogen oxidase
VVDDVDLIVVGAGISGLAAAWFYRHRRPRDREPIGSSLG